MSRTEDRIPVPTNGHRMPVAEAPAEGPPATTGAGATDLRIAVTPAQAIVGFGIIASLVLLLLGRRRRGG